MAKTIVHAVRFRASPEQLFDIYMDSKKHSAAIGARVVMRRKIGARFTAHDGWISGKNLAIVPKRMIVQSWRGADWKKSDGDSILVLTFSRVRAGGRITVVHANVPDDSHALIKRGWYTHYWNRWRAYLRRQR